MRGKDQQLMGANNSKPGWVRCALTTGGRAATHKLRTEDTQVQRAKTTIRKKKGEKKEVQITNTRAGSALELELELVQFQVAQLL
jgi:hypothetical protein